MSQLSPVVLLPYLCTLPFPKCSSPHVLDHLSLLSDACQVSPCREPMPAKNFSSHLSPHFVPNSLSAHLSVHLRTDPLPSYSSPHFSHHDCSFSLPYLWAPFSVQPFASYFSDQFSYHPAFSVPDFACFCALLSILAKLLHSS
uniref:Putative ovule protein n=1 Tax=Solanum chacoense TaxID=4108 RepID=A0A0V0HF94_SOLCH